MSLKIYTYVNPYELEYEEYWDDIRSCPHFCVSQTLVNGLREVTKAFDKNNISTVKNLINHLYKDWDDIRTKVKQLIEVDNAISLLKIEGDHPDSIRKSLLNNSNSIVNSLRILSALNLDPNQFSIENINVDQKYLVDIYKIIFEKKNSAFRFVTNLSENDINQAIKETLDDSILNKESKIDYSLFNLDTVVINGVHQFSPDILCAIEDLLKYKNVILIFNYQKQYSEVYDTWLKIYSDFDKDIRFSTLEEFSPNPFLKSKYVNVLADSMGKLINCDYKEHNDEINHIEVIEFENVTEFANYVAKLFDKAMAKKLENSNNTKSPLYYMDEHFYSASTKVNDILKAYFPNQFGERHFLDYPIGHFFIATMNMWDSDNNTIVVNNFSDIKECLNAGILHESKNGLLINSFNKVLPYIEELSDFDSIINKLNQLRKYINITTKEIEKVGYFNVSSNDLTELVKSLNDLENIIRYFFESFKNENDNFKSFYEKIKKFIKSKVDDASEFDKEMLEVMKQLLERMSKSDVPNSGSFITLKKTMSYYLSQDEYINSGAKWIVRGFEQIDGDILKSDTNDGVYHFCCLSDKDICASKDERLPWPLDVSFFRFIQIPLDWKYQIFVKSKSEYHNFNRYALLYGLEFARGKCKFSYVKNENNKENGMYHILSLLGIKIKKYNSYENTGFSNKINYPSFEQIDVDKYINSIGDLEKLKFSICPFKFASESIVQNHTIFRDRFLIHNYMRILIRNKTLEELQGTKIDKIIIQGRISKNFEELEDKFKVASSLEKAQLLAQTYKDVTNKYYCDKGYFRKISFDEKIKMSLDEDFLLKNPLKDKEFRDLSVDEMKNIFENIYLSHKKSSYCKYCASKDICLEEKN